MIPTLYLSIPTYTLLAAIGLCVSVIFVYFRLPKAQFTFVDLVEYLVAGAILGFIFSRLIFVIGKIPTMESLSVDEIGYYVINGGIVFYGGLIGLVIAIAVVSRIKKRNIRETWDFFCVAFPLFHAFARIGCLLAGCCYGKEWSWGIVMAGEDVVRFPVQFFESICNMGIFIALMLKERKTGSMKGNMCIYLFAYSLCRFVLEFFRGDAVRGVWFGVLSTSQIIAVAFIVICTITTIKAQMKKAKFKTE